MFSVVRGDPFPGGKLPEKSGVGGLICPTGSTASSVLYGEGDRSCLMIDQILNGQPGGFGPLRENRLLKSEIKPLFLCFNEQPHDQSSGLCHNVLTEFPAVPGPVNMASCQIAAFNCPESFPKSVGQLVVKRIGFPEVSPVVFKGFLVGVSSSVTKCQSRHTPEHCAAVCATDPHTPAKGCYQTGYFPGKIIVHNSLESPKDGLGTIRLLVHKDAMSSHFSFFDQSLRFHLFASPFYGGFIWCPSFPHQDDSNNPCRPFTQPHFFNFLPRSSKNRITGVSFGQL